jgi:hypothetical protein
MLPNRPESPPRSPGPGRRYRNRGPDPPGGRRGDGLRAGGCEKVPTAEVFLPGASSAATGRWVIARVVGGPLGPADGRPVGSRLAPAPGRAGLAHASVNPV